MTQILVVCEGNVCRSPMAAAMLGNALPDIDVRSAGLAAPEGEPADPIAVKLMSERGIDLTDHRATQLHRVTCSSADIIFAMTVSQVGEVQSLYPEMRGRVFRLGEFLNEDIPDPYRKSESTFRSVLLQLDKALGSWVPRLHRI